jgi:transposase
VERRRRHPGRRRLEDRKVLCGIMFVLHAGIRWEFLPQELGFGSGTRHHWPDRLSIFSRPRTLAGLMISVAKPGGIGICDGNVNDDTAW